jgi:aryl-alcohol dehydrogenase-like predicted oxidoreductase
MAQPLWPFQCRANFYSYAAGQSEVVMGQAIKKYAWNRNDIVISTKLNWGKMFHQS